MASLFKENIAPSPSVNNQYLDKYCKIGIYPGSDIQSKINVNTSSVLCWVMSTGARIPESGFLNIFDGLMFVLKSALGPNLLHSIILNGTYVRTNLRRS